MRRADLPVAIVVVAMVFALAFELNYASSGTTSSLSATLSASANFTPSSTTNGVSAAQSTSANSTSIGLAWFGAPTPAPSSCGREEAAFGGTGDGYNTTLYLPWGDGGEYLLGSTICILTNFQNTDNQSTSSPSTEIVKVLNSSSGVTVYQGSCSVPSSHSGSFAPKSAWNCAVIWDTSKPYNGILPTTRPAFELVDGREVLPYDVSFTISLANSYQVQMGGGGIGFTPTPPSTSTTSSSTTSVSSTTTSTSTSTDVYQCGTGDVFTPLTGLQGGPLYLKVTTDQGAVVNNGSVLVTHVGTNGTANYCINFAGGSPLNSTGYFSITAADGLSPAGGYNLTLLVGAPLPSGYVGSLPPFNVMTNMGVAIRWSVPSGAVLVITHPQGSTEVATTTTTATSMDAVWGGVNLGPAKVKPAQ